MQRVQNTLTSNTIFGLLIFGLRGGCNNWVDHNPEPTCMEEESCSPVTYWEQYKYILWKTPGDILTKEIRALKSRCFILNTQGPCCTYDQKTRPPKDQTHKYFAMKCWHLQGMHPHVLFIPMHHGTLCALCLRHWNQGEGDLMHWANKDKDRNHTGLAFHLLPARTAIKKSLRYHALASPNSK